MSGEFEPGHDQPKPNEQSAQHSNPVHDRLSPTDDQPSWISRNKGGAVFATAAIFVLAGALGVGIRSCGKDDKPTPRPAIEHTPKSDGQPAPVSQTLRQMLGRTNPNDDERPKVISNFDLATIISRDYPRSKKSVDLFSFSARCKDDNTGRKFKANRNSIIAITSTSAKKPIQTRELTDEHVDRLEDLRTRAIELRDNSARTAIKNTALGSQLIDNLTKRISVVACGSNATPVSITVKDRQTIIPDQAFEDTRSIFPFDFNKKQAFYGGLIVLMFVGLGALAALNARNNEDQGHH